MSHSTGHGVQKRDTHVIGSHQHDRKGTNWDALMQYEIENGEEMTFEEIAQVAGITKQRVEQVYAVAIRKLARNAAVLRLAREARA